MKNSIWYYLILCFLYCNEFRMTFADVNERSGITRTRGARKLFGGYRITPKFCKATRTPINPPGGPNICMFNHECNQRDGEVVGACMDGFLFGACCQLPEDAIIGDTLHQDYASGVTSLDNSLSSKITPTTHRSTPLYNDLTSNSVSQITAALLNSGNPPFSGNGGQNYLPDGDESAVVHVGGDTSWSTTGITHQQGVDTEVDDEDNEINSNYFSPTKETDYKKPTTSAEQTTMRYADTYPPPILQISVSNAPLGYTPFPTIQRPLYRPKPPKPTGENYVLIPTLTHDANRPDQTESVNSIVNNIVNSFNHTTTGRPLSTFSYVSSSSSLPSTRQPVATSRKPPSTSYVFSTTIPPRRTDATTSKRTTTKYSKKPTRISANTNKYSVSTVKPPSTSYVYSSTFKPTSKPYTVSASGKPTKPKPSYVYSSTYKPTKPPKPPSTSYVYSSTFKPTLHSTFANTPDAFVSPQTTPSYVYGSGSTYRPPATVSSTVGGLGFTVTSQPVGQYSPFPSPAPTLIVLGPATDDIANTYLVSSSSNGGQTGVPTRIQSPTTTGRPPQLNPFPEKKPINHVTINNHVTQNIYSTQRPQTSSSSQNLPSPTVIITPKPTISSSYAPLSQEDFDSIVVTSTNDMVNFPPDRNPNLNLSQPIYTDEDITTPNFIDDEAMNEKVESFVNQIIYGLQEPFDDLKDIVYNQNTNSTTISSGSPTKKPNRRQGTTTKRPVTKPNAVRTTTKRPIPTRRPASSSVVPTRKQSTTTRRSVTTKRLPTTTQNLIEEAENELNHQTYKDQCGVRPLFKTGRIVGGKGANFGDFPWQVLVRESTWLGLFTKNKCGGVLISDKYVMTAAHCQPGFLASLVAVFGEFDISGDLETRKPTSRNVRRVIVHRKYDAATFENDLALLELESPVKFDAHIIPICLPPENADFTGRVATVTGWGRLKYGGGVPSILQEVQVPVMENHVCQEMFRTAGHSKVILESFLCAGYANGQKDSCEGDSGGPLVLQRPDGRYQLAGTVSHGIKCAAPYLPGVYMRTTFYKPWITSITGIE